MEHVVFYPGADGTEVFRRAADLEEAVRTVERLRNDQGIGDASVFALTPVPLSFRTYVHVELTSAEPEQQPVAAGQPEPAAVEPTIPPPPVAPDEETASQAPEPSEPDPSESSESVGGAEDFQIHDQLTDESAPAEPVEEDQVAAEVSQDPVPSEDPEPEQQVQDSEPGQQEPPAPEQPAGWTEPAPVGEVAPVEEPIAIPAYESSPSELPPLTLAPGPLLFDADGAPLASAGSYDPVEEAQVELSALVPADFTDLIPKDIAHGDLARNGEAPEATAPEEPSDVSSPEGVQSPDSVTSAPIPAARQSPDEPAEAHREGARGLGFFGG